MKPTSLAICLALATGAVSAGALAHSTLATVAGVPATAPASAPASGAARATRAASAACASLGASMPQRGHAVTSKVRHIPVEGDACADSAGVAPPLPR